MGTQAKIGFFQEVQANGSVANSFMRLLELLFFILLCAYTFFSFVAYNAQLIEYTTLLKTNCITEQSYNMLVSQLKRIDWDIFVILVIASVVPKAIQKFAEAKTGVKDTTESSVTTTTIDKSQTTTPLPPIQ